MNEQRQRVEAEARERYPDLIPGDERANWSWKLRRDAFTAGRTVTAEQVEAAARAMHNAQADTPWGESQGEREADIAVQRSAFRAAGLLIERDDDHE